MTLNGKNVVVTGVLQGIGRAVLDRFASEGANVFACCQKETEEFVSHIAELKEKYSVDIIPVYFDLNDSDSIKAAVKTITLAKLPISGLVNIAGMAKDALFQMVTAEQMQQVFQINFFSQVLFTQYIVKLMLRHGGGSIVNISSVTALDGNEGQFVYGASKAAWLSATKTMSIELGPKGIRVNAICPGVILTPMTQGLVDTALKDKLAKTSLNRIGKAEEIASTAEFLISDASSFITGQFIRIDGGLN